SIRAREDASEALLNYGYNFFETAKVKSAGDTVLKPRVYKSSEEVATLGISSDIYLTVPRGQVASLKTTAHVLKEPLIAPIALHEPLGELTISDGSGQVIAHAPLIAFKAVPEGGLWTRMTDAVA